MNTSNPPDHSAAQGDETNALARVVAVEADRAWLEPMQTGSCSSCASAAVCGSKGIGSMASRLEARRFMVSGAHGLVVGETVEIAFGAQNLVKAAAVAYVLPLLSALLSAAIVQDRLGRDGATLLAALFGMAAGFLFTKLIAGRMEAKGALNARIIRRHHRHPIHFSPSGVHPDA